MGQGDAFSFGCIPIGVVLTIKVIGDWIFVIEVDESFIADSGLLVVEIESLISDSWLQSSWPCSTRRAAILTW